MLYIVLNTYQVKILYLKKSLLGQYESAFYQKEFQAKLIEEGKIANVDIIASAIREALTSLPSTAAKDKDITLILPQQSFTFMRTDMPVDIAPSVLNSYIREKARTQLSINIDDYWSDYLLQENNSKKQILFYGIEKALTDTFRQPFTLLDMQITAVIPESLAYFKLFEKTLRKDKKENIFYVSYNKNILSGYVYDSHGLLENEKWIHELKEGENVQEILKQKAIDYELSGKKLNRLILSGPESESVRQDTFTKQVGVWTNPLKRIIPNFYQEYVKILGGSEEKSLPFLEYDACIGTFILGQENKEFSMIGKSNKMPKINDTVAAVASVPKKIPVKLILLFAGSFIGAFILLYLLSKANLQAMKINLPFMNFASPTPTVTPTLPPPTPTPTPAIARSDVKIKILNGSGISGKANEVKELLKEKGYEEILTGNADSFDYDKTEIQIKKDKAGDLKTLIAQDVKDNTSTPTYSDLDEDEAADIVIIVGTDFK